MKLPDNYQDVVDRFIAVCQADKRIVAAFLGGSYAKDEADKYSDLDLYLVATDEAYGALLAQRDDLIRKLGEPLFLESFGRTHGRFVIFSNGADCEIWFGRESGYHQIHVGAYRVLLDKTGILAGEAFPMQEADPARQTEILRQQIDWFWHELSHFIKAMGRKQLWFAFGQLEVMRQMCVNLARLRHDFSDAYGGEEPYFKIEQALPVEQLSPLRATYCVMEYAPMLQAARVVCRYYQEIAPNLARGHHLAYQTSLEHMMMGQLNDLDEGRLRM
ncbi:MAG: aminoglycoside 6-adenylyltransferase [Thermoflexales bacterium]